MKIQEDKIKSVIVEVENMKSQKEFRKARKFIENHIMKFSDDYRLYEEMADIDIYIWNLNKAEKSIDYALELNKMSATWNYLKWFILLSKNKPKESLKYLEKSNELLWNNSEVLRNLWWAYTMSNNVEKGIAILKRALVLAPWDTLIAEDLAMALIWKWEIAKWNKILEEIKKSIKKQSM